MSWLAKARLLFAGLRARLDLQEEAAAQDFTLSTTIVPITSADDVLRLTKFGRLTTVDPGATGSYAIATVPTGKRWILYGVRIRKVAGATVTANDLNITNKAGLTAIVVEAFSSSTDKSKLLSPPLPMDPGWQIRANIDAYTAGDTIAGEYYYLEEDAY